MKCHYLLVNRRYGMLLYKQLVSCNVILVFMSKLFSLANLIFTEQIIINLGLLAISDIEVLEQKEQY